jgi:hypothetical protein
MNAVEGLIATARATGIDACVANRVPLEDIRA